MSVYLYDNALTDKIKYWTEATDIHVYSPEETARTFEVIADTTGDRPIKLPIICLRRKSGFQLLSTNKEPLSYEGLTLNASYDKGEQLSAIPISIAYQIDVYTRYFKEADEYVRNLVFNIINYPQLTVILPYQSADIRHDSTIRLTTDIEDNSAIPERLIPGQFTRFTLNIEVPDAYLWGVDYKSNYHMDSSVVTVTDEITYKDDLLGD